MSDIPFHRTRMGERFFDATLPSLVREVARLSTVIERLVAILERTEERESQPAPPPHAEEK
jgi:hypothetical protein